MNTTTIEHLEIGMNHSGTWYVFDSLNRVVVKDEMESEKQAYDYARYEYITKPFFNGLVYKQLNREEFVAQWMEHSAVLYPLFLRANSTGYTDMQLVVAEGAGRWWDAID